MAKETDWFADAQEDLIKASMQDEQTKDAESWNPEEGEVLKARMIKAEMFAPKHGGTGYRVYVEDLTATVKKDEKPPILIVWGTRKTLKEGLIDAAPAVGSLMAIQFFGKIEATTDSGRDWFSYKVVAQESDLEYWAEVARAFRVRQDKQQDVSAIADSHVGPSESPF